MKEHMIYCSLNNRTVSSDDFYQYASRVVPIGFVGALLHTFLLVAIAVRLIKHLRRSNWNEKIRNHILLFAACALNLPDFVSRSLGELAYCFSYYYRPQFYFIYLLAKCFTFAAAVFTFLSVRAVLEKGILSGNVPGTRRFSVTRALAFTSFVYFSAILLFVVLKYNLHNADDDMMKVLQTSHLFQFIDIIETIGTMAITFLLARDGIIISRILRTCLSDAESNISSVLRKIKNVFICLCICIALPGLANVPYILMHIKLIDGTLVYSRPKLFGGFFHYTIGNFIPYVGFVWCLLWLNRPKGKSEELLQTSAAACHFNPSTERREQADTGSKGVESSYISVM